MLSCWLLFGLLPSVSAAESLHKEEIPLPDQPDWVIKVYQPQNGYNGWWRWDSFLDVLSTGGFSFENSQHLSSSAGREEWLNSIRLNTELIQRNVQILGDQFPQGSAFLFDPDTETVAVKTTRAAMQHVDWIMGNMEKNVPQRTTATLQIVEAPAPVIRQAIADSRGNEDHAFLLKRLQEQDQGGIVHISQFDLAKGQITRAHSGLSLEQPKYLIIGNQQRLQTLWADPRHKFEEVLETSPARPGELFIKSKLRFQTGKETAHQLNIPAPVTTDQPVPVSTYRIPGVNLESDITLPPDTTYLMSVWPSSTMPEADAAVPSLQAAFISLKQTPVLAAANARLIEQLKTYADEAEPIDESAENLKRLPFPVGNGKEFAVIRVPPDFLQKEPDEPVDPFAVDKTQAQISLTVREALSKVDVSLQLDSKAYFNKLNNLLFLVATKDEIEKARQALTPLRSTPLKLLSYTLHIVEMPATEFATLSEGALQEPEHSKAWQIIEDLADKDQAKIISTFHSGDTPGNDAELLFRTGTEELSAGNWESVQSLQKNEKADKAAQDDSQPDPLDDVAKHAPEGSLAMQIKNQVVGTTLRIRTSQGPGWEVMTLGINLKHHYSANGAEVQAQPANSQASHKDYPSAHIVTSLSMAVGGQQMIGSWQLKDRPDRIQAAFLSVHEQTFSERSTNR